MDPEEFRFRVLARALMSGDQRMICSNLNTLTGSTFPNVSVVDKCNLPLLMAPYADRNPDVREFLKQLDYVKAEIHKIKKPRVLETFKNGLIRTTPRGEVSIATFLLLSRMLTSDDPDYVRTGFELFTELNFENQHYEVVYDIARERRNQYPEAEALVRKIELSFSRLDQVDEHMDMGHQHNEEEEDSEDEDDASVTSDESGFEGESNEVLQEDVRNKMEADSLFEMAFAEVLLKNLADCLKIGRFQWISLFLMVYGSWVFPLPLYRFHEISRLIFETRAPTAAGLYSRIEMMGEREHRHEKHETFSRILAGVGDTITNETMTLLMTYWRKDGQEYYLHTLVKTLLAKNVSLDLFEKFEVKRRIQMTGWRIPEFHQLLLKIADLKTEKELMERAKNAANVVYFTYKNYRWF